MTPPVVYLHKPVNDCALIEVTFAATAHSTTRFLTIHEDDAQNRDRHGPLFLHEGKTMTPACPSPLFAASFLPAPETIQKSPMKPIKHILLSGMLAVALMAVAPFARAQIQTTGTPGSPSTTTTIDGNQLPAPPPKFDGVIKETLEGSKTWWPARGAAQGRAPSGTSPREEA